MRCITRMILPIALFACLAAARPVPAQELAIPPYDRAEAPGEPPPVPGAEGEVQGRGPIHEGFAQPGAAVGRPAGVVPKEPPAPIPETPPDQRPAGDNVVWLSGYWSWGEDRSDFLWVSGCWRVAPAGRTWVPGYWAQADDGWRWVSGLWSLASQSEVPYVPEPPASLDRGPSVPPPEEGSCYVPGTWLYDETRWLWRPGYYAPERAGLLYTPSRYVWTPRGYLFASGFWDQPLDSRGVLFAPVYFGSDFSPSPGWAYQPSCAVNIGGALGSLWVGPGANSYAFGDYYGPRYARAGYQSWLAYGPRSRDPLYGYYRHANRDNPSWRGDLVATHNGRLRGTISAPPATLAGQSRIRDGSLRTVAPFSSYRNPALRLTKVTATDRAKAASASRRGPDGRFAPRPTSRQHSPSAGYTPSPTRATSRYVTPAPSARQSPRMPTRTGEVPRSHTPPVQRSTSPPARSTPPAQHYATPPAARYTPPVQHNAAPARHTQPAQHYPAPAARYTQPKQRYAAPAARPTPPAQHYATPPAARYTPPVQHNAAPARHTQPAQHYPAPAARYSPPAQHYAAPPARHAPPARSAPPAHSSAGRGRH